ncbi:2'-phosphotransferase [Malassezia caprae]|uniref:2'-phosphotransferase n=1 Tax=Malassezia caprae TaxID=1381934 RepID=A0AAF0E8U6_9BASI|nr:2'-phosphotransferase [Malassezia caprae]
MADDAAPPGDAARTREQAKQWKKERKLLAQKKAQAPQDAPRAKAQGRVADPPDVQLSKTLSYILRHGTQKEHLEVRADGYVRLDAVLARPRVQKIAMDDTGRSPSSDDVEVVVQDNAKKRFELTSGSDASPTDDGTCRWIRAVQGHSIAAITDLSHTSLTTSNVGEHLAEENGMHYAIHGTDESAFEQILASGALKRMQRNQIHLAKGRPGASGLISGMRQRCSRLLYVDVGRALSDGVPFGISSNGVVLTPGVGDTGALPLSYVSYVTDAEGRQVWTCHASTQ